MRGKESGGWEHLKVAIRHSWLLLLLLLPISLAGTLGTFVSRTYARIYEGESALFHFYVMGEGRVRFKADTDDFFVSFSPPSLEVKPGCYGERVMLASEGYIRACRVDVKITPRAGISTGRYVVPVYAVREAEGSRSGISLGVSLVGQMNFVIDYYGPRIFIPPEPIEVPRAFSRVTFSSSSEPKEATGPKPVGRNVITFGNPATQEAPLPSNPVSENIKPITGLAVGKSANFPWIWLIVIAGALVAGRVLGWI